jgi:hypothetical protein
LLPILSYVVTIANVDQLASQLRMLVEFIPNDAVMDQTGFSLATLETTVNYLMYLDVKEEDEGKLPDTSTPTAFPEIPKSKLTKEIDQYCRKIFKIDSSEVILNRFSCVYPNVPHSTKNDCQVLTMYLGGWLYVSTHHLYFHTFLQYSDKAVIPFNQIKHVAKAKFAKILDNSILVTTKDGKVTIQFTSLKFYSLINSLIS